MKLVLLSVFLSLASSDMAWTKGPTAEGKFAAIHSETPIFFEFVLASLPGTQIRVAACEGSFVLNKICEHGDKNLLPNQRGEFYQKTVFQTKIEYRPVLNGVQYEWSFTLGGIDEMGAFYEMGTFYTYPSDPDRILMKNWHSEIVLIKD